MSLDPYPDLPDAATGVHEEPAEHDSTAERVELSEADSRLLRALSRHEPPVVRAVEDEPRTAPVSQADRAPRTPSGSSSLAPVFRAPPD